MSKIKSQKNRELANFRHLFFRNNKKFIEKSRADLGKILEGIDWDIYDPKLSKEENAQKFDKKYPKYKWRSGLEVW